MAKKFKLKRLIRNAADTEDITEVTVKDEKDVSASDFYDMEVSTDGKMKMGSMSVVIANLTGLTESQVAELHIKDYMILTEEVSSFLE